MFNKRPSSSVATAALADAGIWTFFVGGSVLTFAQAGPVGTAALFSAFSIGRIWLSPSWSTRRLVLAAGAAVACMALEPHLVVSAVLAGCLGAVSGPARMPDPWLASNVTEGRTTEGSGWATVLGAAAGAVLIAARAGDPTACLAFSAGLLLCACLAHRGDGAAIAAARRGFPTGRLSAGGWACLGVIGLRLLEPGLITGVSSAVFFIPAWAFGARAGARWAGRVDSGLASAAPFGVGAAMSGLGVVEGPALLFIYAAVAFLVTMNLGSQVETEPAVPNSLPTSRATRGFHVLAVLAGAAVAVAGLASAFSAAVWSLGALAIAGGFVDLLLPGRPKTQGRPEKVRAEGAKARVTPPSPVTLLSRLPLGAPPRAPLDLRKVAASPEAPSAPRKVAADVRTSPDVEAAAILLEALRQARGIRREALAGLAGARSSPSEVRARTRAAIDALLDSLPPRAEG